ncbi:hypothetical protein EWM64_g9868 [Hericium alpestre]|uniref:Uncharacterized protein n=1 Tax=Hericium alpestre TaxID=135208 RepID=A0A4Y9ZI82_9AGAM|nr:hypothetical protein EWM64_g9868 [Hericium alpestre]
MSVSDMLKTLRLPTVYVNPLLERYSREEATAAWVHQVALEKKDALLSAADEAPQVLYIVPSAADAAALFRSLCVPRNESDSESDSETRSSVARLSDSDDGHASESDVDHGRSSSSEVEDGRSGGSDTAVDEYASGGDDHSQDDAFAIPSSRAFTMASGWCEKPFVTEGPHFEFYIKLWGSAAAGEAMGDPWKQSVFVRKNMRWWTEKSDDASAQDHKPSYETDTTETSGVDVEAATETVELAPKTQVPQSGQSTCLVAQMPDLAAAGEQGEGSFGTMTPQTEPETETGGPALPTTSRIPYLGRPWEL